MDTLGELVRNEGQCCCMYKCDLSRAYRQIPVDPINYSLVVKYYFDTRLHFGLPSEAMFC